MEVAYLSTQLMVWLFALGSYTPSIHPEYKGYQLILLSNPQGSKLMHLGSHMEVAYLSTQLMVWLFALGSYTPSTHPEYHGLSGCSA